MAPLAMEVIMGRLPSVRPLFYLAMFGLACAAVLAIAGIVGAIWFLANHVQIV